MPVIHLGFCTDDGTKLYLDKNVLTQGKKDFSRWTYSTGDS